MVAGTSDFSHFILGLLSIEPMSGYDIKRSQKTLKWLIGSPSFGNLYPTLHRLLDSGLVTVETLLQDSKPPRKIYSITQRGRDVLKEWLGRPLKDISFKAFVMHLIIAESNSTSGLLALLETRRAQVAANHTAMIARSTTQPVDENERQRLALDYGISLAKAELAWLEATIYRLSQSTQQSKVMEVLVGEGAESVN